MKHSDPALPNARAAAFLYRWRWPLTLVALVATGLVLASGLGRIADRTGALGSLGDTSNGSGTVQPLVFNPTFGVWFGEKDAAVETFYGIEDRFVAEDFVMVTFESDDDLGVFSREALATIGRLTERFLTVPGVRHVRSLTYNPWIRWGTIEDELGSEEGLIISDLVEGDPNQLTDDELIERMIAVLGARRAAERVGEARVRSILGPEADFDDHIGEPLLLGTIVDERGSTSAIQVQVLRPRVDQELLAQAFAGDEGAKDTAAALYSVQVQRAAVRGIEHHLRIEQGLALPTPERERLAAWIEGLPEGEEKTALALELNDSTRNFMRDAEGRLVRKYFEYDRTDDGFVDRSDPTNPLPAYAEFTPAPRNDYRYHLGGVPFFERNFEEVGMADAKYMGLMFLIIIAALFAVFRGPTGVGVPMLVVVASLAGMLGLSFAMGDLLNNLTMMSPNMLTAVGIADAIHLVAAYIALRPNYTDRRALVTEVMRRNVLPVLLTSITTAIGFYSLTVSALAPVGMLGYTVGTGTILAYLMSMTLVPAALSLVPLGKKKRRRPSRLAGFFTPRRSDRMVAFLVARRRPILITAGLLALISAVGLTRVEVDTDFRGMFPDDNPTMSDFHWIEERMGGVGDLEIVFTGHGQAQAEAAELDADQERRLADLRLRDEGAHSHPDEFQALSPAERTELQDLADREARWNAARIGVSPEFLARLDAFETRLREEMAQPDSELAVITDFLSPLDILRKMHQVQNENRASDYRVPAEADVPDDARIASLSYDEWTEEWSRTPGQTAANLAAQYYLQYENGARPGENLTTQLSADRVHLRMQGRVLQASSMEHIQAFRRIEQIAEQEFPDLVASEVGGDEGDLADFTISGKTLLFARTSHLFTVGFIQSISIALVTITVLIGLIFRSLRLALVSLVPNVLPIVLPLSVFGLLGVPLHGPAILVSSVALGVCVDDTIHFLTKFVRARKAGKTIDQALSYVMQESGAAITITTLVLVIGFGTLLLSDFTPNLMMGALATLMIGLAWFADLVVTPAVLSFFGDRAAEPVPAPVPARPEPATLAS